MLLHAVCYYRGESESWNGTWRNQDYAARNLVKAVKHLPFRGFTDLKTVSGKTRRVENDESGRKVALSYVAQLLASKITDAGYVNASVVPLPASSHVDPIAMFTGRRIAEAIQQKNSAFVSAPILYFDRPLAKSAGGGGTRNAYAIQGHLRLAVSQTPQNIVLLDDVCSTGGHLKAAARFLRKHGVEIRDAFVIGRTVWEKPASMFNVASEELETHDLFDF